MVWQENSENRPFVTGSGKETDSSEILDLSCRHITQKLTDVPKSLLSFAPNKQQLIQQSSITNTALTPMDLHIENDTAQFTEHWRPSQKRKKRTDNDGHINYYQINNVQINSQGNNDQLNNSQINCNQINVSEILHKPLKNDSKIDADYINVDQTSATDINSNSHINSYSSTNNHKSSPVLIGQSISHQNSIPVANLTNVQYLPTNISMPNSLPLHMPLSTQEKDKSTMLTSITRAPRPFKVYPKDPLVLSAGDKDNSDAYNTFRDNVLKHIKNPEKESTNSKMRRTPNPTGTYMSSIDDDEKNRAYLEKRRKNNAAAKRSRDARRAKEDELAIRAAFLEQQNSVLKKMLDMCMKQLREHNVQLDFKSIIEMNENALRADTGNTSS